LGAASWQEQPALPTVLFKGAGHRRVLPFFNQMVIMAKQVTQGYGNYNADLLTASNGRGIEPGDNKLAGG
jgi:hypothetical protein